MIYRLVALLPLSIFASGCAATGPVGESATDSTPAVAEASDKPAVEFIPNPYFNAIRATDDKHEQDRLAILAMQGEYRVGFHFQETVALKADYEYRDDKTTGAYEMVLVVEDTPSKIVLQHILVMPGGGVIKHWRQDWMFEPEHHFEFAADQTWDMVAVSEDDRTGAWTQCVYEVSDAPRYCGNGRFEHDYGVSTWTSGRSWRPLPRREYTTRDDYNALNAGNRHTITANGWTHEQDNTKTIRAGREIQETLVREFGFNDYRNIAGYDFEPGYAYWRKTQEYWASVREAWDRRLVPGTSLVLHTEVDGMAIITATFAQAADADSTSVEEERIAIEALLTEYTESHSSMVSSTDN
ncbi:MAG: DUF6607 family protein [Pseudomonadota bacterium]